jgi:hypothetical protein
MLGAGQWEKKALKNQINKSVSESEMRIFVSDQGPTRVCGEAYRGTPQPPSPKDMQIYINFCIGYSTSNARFGQNR